MIVIHLFKTWQEALRSPFGPAIKHWPNEKKFKNVQNVMIMESGTGKIVTGAYGPGMTPDRWNEELQRGMKSLLKSDPKAL